VIAGTPKFMAPELISRKNYDPLKADIWAFGIMLYWMALGYFPQDANPKKKKMTMKKW
jgi:carbon catabolite-derepressing protein kinase